jgi:iron complex outermembrane receptor protein
MLAQEVAAEDSLMTVEFDEIVVTGSRIGGETMQIPMAVGVVSARDFLNSRRAGLNDALWGMPGVFVQSRAGGQDVRLTIRGFGARGQGDRSNAATIRGIKVLVDGIPETEPDGRTALDLVDLHAANRIEVIRSNASTLFGNASGGVVNIETVPWFVGPYVDVSALVGGFGLKKNNLSAGVLVGSGRVSFSLTRSVFGGWRKNSGSSSTQLNSAFMLSPTESTHLKLLLSAASNRFSIPGPLTEAEYRAEPSQASPVYDVRRERRYNRIARLGLQVTTSVAANHTFEVLGYLSPKVLERSERNTYRDFNRLHLGGGGVSRWHSEDQRWHVVAGIDGATQDGTILFYNLRNGERGDSLRTNKREAASTFGGFAQGEWRVVESLSFIVGGRFDRQLYVSQNFAAGARRSAVETRLVFEHLTPKVALLYRLSLNHSAYVNVGGGVESPAFNEVDPPASLPDVALNPFLKPMTSGTMEAGIKGMVQGPRGFLVRSVSYSAAAYRIDIENEIVPFEGGAWFFSAGRSRRYGFEAGADMELRGGFSVKSALTLLRARYVEYSNELGDFAANLVPGIPPSVFNLRFRYLATGGLAAEVGLEHVGPYFADDANSVIVGAYSTVNASLAYRFSWRAVRLHAFVGMSNVFDKTYVASAFINPSSRTSGSGSPKPAFIEPGLPRQAFVGADVRIGF